MTNQNTGACSFRPIRKSAACQRIFAGYFTSPLQGSFDGDSFFSASAPRLASTFYLSYAFCFPNRCFQVQCKVFCKLVNFCKYSMFCRFTGALTLSDITT